MSSIDINYHDMIKKAERLESLAGDLRLIVSNNLNDMRSGANQNWKGSSAELCKKRMQQLSHRIDGQAKSLQSAASELRAAAERYRRLESIANSIFGG